MRLVTPMTSKPKTPHHQLNADDVEVKTRQLLHGGFAHLHTLELRFKQFAGGWSPWVHREVSERPMVSAVLPYDPNTQTIVLIEQMRVGPFCAKHNPWLFELVAGLIDEGENPLTCAQRELHEEAGLHSDTFHPVTTYWASPGGSTERVHVFCAKVDSSHTQSGTLCGMAHEAEDIRVHVFPIDTAFELLHSGKIDNAPTVIALQWLALNQTTLEQQWG